MDSADSKDVVYDTNREAVAVPADMTLPPYPHADTCFGCGRHISRCTPMLCDFTVVWHEIADVYASERTRHGAIVSALTALWYFAVETRRFISMSNH
jgi:hypothetical protein